MFAAHIPPPRRANTQIRPSDPREKPTASNRNTIGASPHTAITPASMAKTPKG
jgi:hypothetical protein